MGGSLITLCRPEGASPEPQTIADKLQSCWMSGQSSFPLALFVYLQLVCAGVAALLLDQCLLISRGMTSYERRRRNHIDYMRGVNPHNLGFFRNWLSFICCDRVNLK